MFIQLQAHISFGAHLGIPFQNTKKGLFPVNPKQFNRGACNNLTANWNKYFLISDDFLHNKLKVQFIV